jgi:hypothetical protein
MYWLLLPVEANAQRHLADETGPSSPTWNCQWTSDLPRSMAASASDLRIEEQRTRMRRSPVATTGVRTSSDEPLQELPPCNRL